MEKKSSLNQFSNSRILELIATLFVIITGIILFVSDFSENSIIDLVFKVDGICFGIAGIIGICGVMHTNKNLPNGETYCLASGRGPFTVFNNIVYGTLALLLALIMIIMHFDECGGVIAFSFGAVALIMRSMYGVFYRNTNCIIIGQEHVYKVKRHKITEIMMEDIIAYTNSISIAGFKLINQEKKAILEWSVYWDSSEQLTKYFDLQGVRYLPRISKN